MKDYEHTIKCIELQISDIKHRDEVPKNIFVGDLQWSALKSFANIEMHPDWALQVRNVDFKYCDIPVVRVYQDSFIDVSTR